MYLKSLQMKIGVRYDVLLDDRSTSRVSTEIDVDKPPFKFFYPLCKAFLDHTTASGFDWERVVYLDAEAKHSAGVKRVSNISITADCFDGVFSCRIP